MTRRGWDPTRWPGRLTRFARFAVVSSVRVPAMGAREVRGEVAVTVLGETGGVDVQILSRKVTGLARDVVSGRRRRTVERRLDGDDVGDETTEHG